MQDLIINKVAQSELTVFNLESLWDGKEIVSFDLQPFLYRGLVLREKEFREALKSHDWKQYEGKHVAIYCSNKAIIPRWAYVLVTSFLVDYADFITMGMPEALVRDYYVQKLQAEDWERYADKMVILKGCGNPIIPESAYVMAMQRLQKVAKKIMYGEACAAVPIWRKPK